MSRCPHCAAANVPIVIADQRLHLYSDRWLACTGEKLQPGSPSITRLLLSLQLAPLLPYLHGLLHLSRSRF